MDEFSVKKTRYHFDKIPCVGMAIGVGSTYIRFCSSSNLNSVICSLSSVLYLWLSRRSRKANTSPLLKESTDHEDHRIHSPIIFMQSSVGNVSKPNCTKKRRAGFCLYLRADSNLGIKIKP
jgi:hypothetical protein